MGQLTQEKFVTLIARHERRVRGFVSTLVRYRNDIDEVVQQTFLTAWRKIGDFRCKEVSLDEDFVRWLCTIARFESLAYIRKHSNSRLFFSSELVSQLADMQMRDATLIEDRQEALWACIEKLAPKQKDMVRRYYRVNMSAADIAEQDGVTRQAIFKMLRQIRKILARCVEKSLVSQGAG